MVRDAGKEPNPFVLERWMVNYARHALTDYDQQRHDLDQEKYVELRTATLNAIADTYPPSFLSEGTPSFRAVVNHSGRFWFSMYRFNVSNGAPPLVPA